MENLPRKLEKDLVKAAGKPAKFKKKEKWTLLLINDSGKTIQIKGIQRLIKTAVLLILVILLSAGGIYSYTKFNSFESFKSFISISNNYVQKENVSKETNINIKPVNQSASQPINQKDTALHNTDTNKKEEKLPDMDKKDIAEPVQKPEIENKQEKIDLSHKIQKSSPVSIDNFECSYKTGKKIFDIKFNIKNSSSDLDSVSGHAIVVLKKNEKDQGKWIVLPDDVKLVSGRPTGKDTGQTFSISFFKTLHFKAKRQTNPEQYKMASIYIFSREGDLLLEQDQEIIFN